MKSKGDGRHSAVLRFLPFRSLGRRIYDFALLRPNLLSQTLQSSERYTNNKLTKPINQNLNKLNVGEILKSLWRILIHSNIYLSISAAFLAYMVSALLKIHTSWEPFLIAFAGTFFLYNLNNRWDVKEDRINYLERAEFFKRHEKTLLIIGISSYGISLNLALFHSFITFLITLTPLILIIVYGVFAKRVFC